MSEKFEIGEVAIYVRPGSQYYGQEVTILSGLKKFRKVTDSRTGQVSFDQWRYKVTPLGPTDLSFQVARPEWLRKKRRDIDRVVSWDDCAWKPSGVSA